MLALLNCIGISNSLRTLAFTRNPSDTTVSPATYTATGASDLILVDQQRNIAVDGSDNNDVIRISAAALSSNALYNYDVRGFAGNDTINIDAALIQDSTINGNLGNDTIVAGSASRNGSLNGSFILGGKDDDTLTARNISDGEVNGNLGNDILRIDGSEASFNASVRGGQGQDTIEVLAGTNFQNGSIFGDKGRDNIEVAAGGTFNNSTILGGEDADRIVVLAASDATDLLIEGNKGDDSIFALGGKTVTIFGGEGKDTIATGAIDTDEVATIDAGIGADSVTLNFAATGSKDIIDFATGDSVAATAVSYAQSASATGTIQVGDTITFGNGVDTINGFATGADQVDIDFAAVSKTDMLGVTEFSDVLASNKIYELYGSFNATTGVFTVGANNAGSSLYIVGGGNETLANGLQNNANIFISDRDLAFADFV